MEDRRIQKSKAAIQNSFFELLREKSLNKITVAEICRAANIGRGTFYLHYMDVYDLYDKLENELYSGLYRLFEDAFPTTDRDNGRRLAEGLTVYIEQHREVFLLMLRADNSRSLQKLKRIFNDMVLQENRRLHPVGDLQYDAVEAVFVVSGMVGVLEQWLADGMTIPRVQIADMLDRILSKVNAPSVQI